VARLRHFKQSLEASGVSPVSLILVEQIGRGQRRASMTSSYDFEVVDRYRLTTDNDADTPVLWDNDPRLPQVGDPHPQALALDPDTNVLLRRKRYQEQDVQKKWVVECEYNTGAPDPSLQAQDPLDEPPDIKYGQERVDVAVQYDLDGNLVVNSAGDPFESGLLLEDALPVVTITDNVRTFGVSDQTQYLLKCNVLPMWGQPAGAVLCTTYGASRQYRNGVVYWQRSSSWKLMSALQTILTGGNWQFANIVDAGYRQLVGGMRQNITSPGGQQLSRPSLLNGAGAVQTAAMPVLVYRTFTVRTAVDFGGADLPDYV
jgi:hypothetical protein